MDGGGETRPGGWFRTLLLGVLLVVVLYTLSVGPVVAIVTKMAPSSGLVEMVEFVYAPLIWLHGNTALKGPLEWYSKLWGW